MGTPTALLRLHKPPWTDAAAEVTAFAAGLDNVEAALASRGVNVMGFWDTAGGAFKKCLGGYDVGDDAIINAAIVQADGELNSRTLFFPDGHYLISSPKIFKWVNVLCAPNAVFKPAAVDLNLFRMDTVSTWDGGTLRLNDIAYAGKVFTIEGAQSPGQFSGENLRSPLIANVDMIGSVSGAATGIYMNAVGTSKVVTCAQISNIRMRNLWKGIHLYATSTSYVNANHFHNILLHGFDTAIHLENAGSWGCGGNLFSNITMQSSLSPATEAGILLEGCSLNQFTNVMAWDWFGNCPTKYAVDIRSGSGNIFMGQGFVGFARDQGSGNYILGCSPKLFGGADLTNDRRVRLSPGTVSAGSTWLSDELPIAGAALGDFVLVGSGQAMNSVQYYGLVTAAGVVKLKMVNRSGVDRTFLDDLFWPIRVIPKTKYTALAAWTPAEIANGSFEAKNITVTGAELGDFVLVSYDQDVSAFFMSAAVTATNVVTVTLHNFSGGALTPTAGNVRVRLIKRRGDFFATVAPGTLATGTGYLRTLTYTGMGAGVYTLVAPGVDIADCMLSGYTYANNLCSIVSNETGVSAALGSTTWYYRIIEQGEAIE